MVEIISGEKKYSNGKTLFKGLYHIKRDGVKVANARKNEEGTWRVYPYMTMFHGKDQEERNMSTEEINKWLEEYKWN